MRQVLVTTFTVIQCTEDYHNNYNVKDLIGQTSNYLSSLPDT